MNITIKTIWQKAINLGFQFNETDAHEIYLALKELNDIEWLKENKKFLSIRAIEKYLEMPDSTLIKAVNGVQNLPKKYEVRLSDFLMGLQNPKSVGKNLK